MTIENHQVSQQQISSLNLSIQVNQVQEEVLVLTQSYKCRWCSKIFKQGLFITKHEAICTLNPNI
jgi:hypothetical protein